ncbi:unnamed protein product, partial [Adineta steineri]
MVEEEESGCFSNVVEGWHGFSTFGKVIDKENNVLVGTSGGWSTILEINSPLVEGSYGNDCVGTQILE